MNWIRYFQYFYYLGNNWNWKLAIVLILQEIKGENKYGINTTGADELGKLAATGVDISHSTMYMPVSYNLLESVFQYLPKENFHHFLDIGCGKGRALCVASHHGYKQLTGIDFSPDFCEVANRNLKITYKKIPFFSHQIFSQNILSYEIPIDVDCIFLFNPFDEVTMDDVVKKIMVNNKNRLNDVFVIYANPLYINLFIEVGFKKLHHYKRMKYFEIAVLKLQKNF